MFAELENTVEGIIRFENMWDEYYIYNESDKSLIGEKTNRIFKIGDKINIRVIEANKQLRKVAFELVADKNIVEHDFFFMDDEESGEETSDDENDEEGNEE